MNLAERWGTEDRIAVSRDLAFLATSVQQNALQTAKYKATHLERMKVSDVTCDCILVSLREYHGGKHKITATQMTVT